ncbi:hypothetical protein [Thalassomonas actiniarum]|uniref:Uncharacterized protein n=1 Tax=Thalassomonas actiniarum TaxID=485447 RepID=A0AAE9YSC7_9GAMM|nr:hypothetical protein [Thalassomonas actiniarum]WDD99822.1 hypothetical protein SG35_003885 [Thalassomonas actiniarum]
MDFFSDLFSKKNKKQIKSLIEKLTPYLYQEWREIEPKIKVLLRIARPSAEKKLKALKVEVNNATKEVDQDLKDSVNSFIVFIEEAFGCVGFVLDKVVNSNSKVRDFIQGVSKSATSFENAINDEINSIKSEKSILFDKLCKFENLLEKIDASPANYDPEVMSYSKSEHFRAEIINNCTKSNFSEERLSRIEEILDLHCLGFYGGSVALLYSQIEGVITDTLIKTGHAKITRNNKLTHIASKQAFPGLSKKMQYTGDNLDCFEEIFNKLTEVKFLDGKKARSISQSRNIILHGNFVKLPDKLHSLCLLLTLYVIILKIRLMPDNKLIESQTEDKVIKITR